MKRSTATEDRPYSRVYHTVVDDERFVGIYDNDRHWACYVRLLMAADAAWPASPHLPLGVRKASVQALIDAGIIDSQPGNRFRVHGLDAERQRRSDKASNAALSRWGNAASIAAGNASAMPDLCLDETSRDETRRDGGLAPDNPPFWQAVQLVESLSQRPFGHTPGSKVWESLEANIRAFGLDEVADAMESLTDIRNPNAAQLVFGADKILHPLSPHPVKDAAQAERDKAEAHQDECRKRHYEMSEEELAEHVRRGECAFKKAEELG